MANQPIKAHFSHKLRDTLFVSALLLTDKPFLKKILCSDPGYRSHWNSTSFDSPHSSGK